jgi:hypothetical protein
MAVTKTKSYRIVRPLLLAGLAAVAAGACSNKQRLPEYDFRNRSLAVVTVAPPRPEILGSGYSRVRGDDALERILGLGSAIALEVSAQQAMPRLQNAATTVNVRDRMGARVLDGAARHLRAIPVQTPGTSDFEIEIRIYRYGITSSSWNSAANFLIDAELFLLDGSSGRRIWKSHVRSTSPVRPLTASGEPAVDGAVSAIALANMTTEEIQAQLEVLADYSADRMLTELINALDDARG